MKIEITFEIDYYTKYGENLYITGSIPELGLNKIEFSSKMSLSEGKWHLKISLNKIYNFTYSYLIKDDFGRIFPEAGPARLFSDNSFKSYRIIDQWRPYNNETPFLTNPFRNIFFKSRNTSELYYDEILITCSANNLNEEDTIYISGSNKYLGNWNDKSSIKMERLEGGIWFSSFKKSQIPPFTEYKFILKNIVSNTIKWEEGLNRLIPDYKKDQITESIIINNYKLNLHAKQVRFAGTAVPVFSLKTHKGSGIGDFLDIIPLAELLSKTGQKIIQILPVNDTTSSKTWNDSYPYSAISIFALHPMYINLKDAGLINDEEYNLKHNQEANRLNNLEEIDYDQVSILKWDYLKKLYNQEGSRLLSSNEFTSFFNENYEWLKPYALFSFFRDRFGTADFSKWKKFQRYDKQLQEEFTNTNHPEFRDIALYYFIQFHLDRQLKMVHSYLNGKGMILKGDIPIGINKNSVEAWCEPEYFNFNVQAGAPPDGFSEKGQNWGFPTYNWEYMERDGYEWWKRRFRKMSEYFDAYRIDHILGFFRIWEIPINSVDALLGYFNPSLPYSVDEIRSMGYNFDYDRDCKPFINECILEEYFKDDSKLIQAIFFDISTNDSLILKREFSTQKGIEHFFNKNSGIVPIAYKEKLSSVLCDVLFIQDYYDRNKFHPRISAHFTKSYSSLSQGNKAKFKAIYDHYFFYKNDGFWYSNAMKKLPSLISSTDMLACGEDLGMIPSCVPTMMNTLCILSLEIERLPKYPNIKFGKTSDYPYLSVCTTGTHDTSTLRGWWKEDKFRTQEYFNLVLKQIGDAPDCCEPWICRSIVENHLNSNSMFTILPIQDWFSLISNLRIENPDQERINIPTNSNHYWRYRMHLSINEIIENEEFIKVVKDLISKSGR